jgi:alkanesulfonate monooxygenase SsuD/methylene tetrahydromethanopterin reductase-like flavin-dependent oxidoreductase (luciferase family)
VTRLKLGILPWPQATDWPAYRDIALRVEALGYDSLWTWDHLYAIFGDPYQPIFEAYTTLAAWAALTKRIQLGLLVGAIPMRNPGLVAKSIATIDHVSGGRAICGLGGAWNELEHTAHGIDFGSGFGQRLDWLDEATGIIRALLDGETVTHQGPHYEAAALVQHPRPIQAHLPIMIGGSGEKKTLRTVARYADIWNAMGPLEMLRHKDAVLRQHCLDVGRDTEAIERTVGCKVVIRDTPQAARRAWEGLMAANRTTLESQASDVTWWLGTPEQIAERMIALRVIGCHSFISEHPAPFDIESIERLIGEVKPMVEAA